MNLNAADRIKALSDVIGKLAPRDAGFASSLIVNFHRYKKLSDKQMYWVDTLSTKATAPPPPVIVFEVGSFAKVIALFAKAKEKLKFPKIRLMVGIDLPVVASLAGPTAKFPGTVNITDGRSFGSNKWYGRVTPDGAWSPGSVAYPELEKVANLIEELGNDPIKTVIAYGAVSGNCSFCGKSLTDEKSTAVGYGPVCAKKWGLASEYKAGTAIIESAARSSAYASAEA